MRKLREVLRLRYELKLGYQQIGRSCAIAVSTVHKYLKRAEKASVSWPLPEDWDEARVEAALFPETAAPSPPRTAARSLPDFPSMHQQLREHKHLTLQLLWEDIPAKNTFDENQHPKGDIVRNPVSYTHLTLPTIYSV